MIDLAHLLDRLVPIAAAAGARIVDIRVRPHDVTVKSDGSPLTEADLAAEAIIAGALPGAAAGIAVVSEEAAERIVPPPGAPFILVDPLDGTREFLGPSGEFTVNIALIEGGRAVAGVVYAPALGRIWRGALGLGAAMAGLPVAEHRAIGSSLKFCLIAEGAADVYPRFGPTMKWDTAAGQAVLEAAGGSVTTREGAPFGYGKVAAGFRNGGFVAWGGAAVAG